MESLLGHDRERTRLRELYEGGRGPHTLLLCGPEGVGRRPLARWLAALVNCAEDDVRRRPCGQCDSCRQVASGEDPDVREIGPERETRGGRSKRRSEIRIDQLVPRPQGDPDPVAPWLWGRPRRRMRVAILDHAEALNAGAANAFLKVLEEPPRWALIVLLAPAPDALLPTVASRCTALRLGTVDTANFADVAPHPALRLGLPGPLLAARADPEAFAAARGAAETFLQGIRATSERPPGGRRARTRGGGQRRSARPAARAAARAPPARYARAADALDRCEAALDAYAQPALALAVLALELRPLLA